MEGILQFCRNEYFSLGLLIINIVLLIIFIINTSSINKSKKIYKTLIKRMGKSNNIEELLNDYLQRVENVEEQNKNINALCQSLNKEIDGCIKKVGMVRYSAFKDMGSDLSFALALLNERNDGVILNGIYSVEHSNVYAKPVKDGKTKYSLSAEEQQAIDIAMQ